MHLVGMNTLLILLSLEPGYPIPGARISHQVTSFLLYLPLEGLQSLVTITG
jgi:hypothetical protein